MFTSLPMGHGGIKDTVSDLHFVKISVQSLTANTDTRVWSVMWVSESLRSAVNRKYVSGILSPDWTRVEAGYGKMSFVCMEERRTHVTDKTLDISDVCLSVELFNTC